jgi:hypothetical protein
VVVKRREFGNDASEVGDASLDIGLSFQTQGRLNSALNSFREAVRMYRICGEQGGAERLLAAALGTLGKLSYTMGK